MVVFFNSTFGTVSIPHHRIYQIRQSKDKIIITYDSGEIIWLDEEKFTPKLNVEYIFFDSEELANMQMRTFYKACENGKKAFFFG